MRTDDFVPQFLPGSTPSLAGGVPPAPPGTIFALAADGGYAVPPRKFALHFGRCRDEVHVPIGVDDPRVSRLHGVLACDGREWWIRNKGKLPIQLPGDVMLLSGHDMPIESGYTPLFIGSPKSGPHLLEVHVVGARNPRAADQQHTRTRPPDIYELSPDERLVLTALAQRYLRQERFPQPVTWNQAAADLNRAPGGRHWTWRGAAHIVGALRERLSMGPDPIPGIRVEDGIGEPVGNTLNHNLIKAMLASATLMPEDLLLLGDQLDENDG
ncbi:hypothetical protein [Nocardia sp. NPDC051750]|uniref:hypothetical protein n=1 Tax=Nocardia sp. NPDC051750 TaxID=3364325 RepID=UPI0037B5FDE8